MSEDIFNRIGIDDSDTKTKWKKKQRQTTKRANPEWDTDARIFSQNDVDLDDFDDEVEAVLSLPMWTQATYTPPDVTFKDKLEEAPVDRNLKIPYQFFRELITNNMIESLQEQTNYYSMKKDGRELRTSAKEIEMFINMYLRMGQMQAAYTRAYWETPTQYGPIVDVMARDLDLDLDLDI